MSTPKYYTPDNDTSSVDGTRTHLLIINGQESSDREYAFIMNVEPSAWTEEELQCDLERFQSRPFSFLR